MFIFRQRGHHAAEPFEGKGGEGHAAEDRPAADAAATQRATLPKTQQQRHWKSLLTAAGEAETGNSSVNVWE